MYRRKETPITTKASSKQTNKRTPNPKTSKLTNQPKEMQKRLSNRENQIETKNPVTKVEIVPGWHCVCQPWLLVIQQPFGTILRQVSHHHKIFCSDMPKIFKFFFNASIMSKQLTASLAPGIWHAGEEVSPSD